MDEFDRLLDGEKSLEEVPDDVRKSYQLYRKILEMYKVRCEYTPSERLKERILRRYKRKSAVLTGVLLGVFASVLFVFVFLNRVPLPSHTKEKLVQVQNPVVSDVIYFIKTVELISDGW